MVIRNRVFSKRNAHPRNINVTERHENHCLSKKKELVNENYSIILGIDRYLVLAY